MIKIVQQPGEGKAILEKAIKELQKKQGKVGFVENKRYPNGGPTVAYVATIQEFGVPSKNIPPRPFMRTTIDKKQSEWKQISYNESKLIMKGKSNAQIAMEILTSRAAGQMRQTISQIQAPPLKEATVKARSRKRANKKITKTLRKPLIDTGYMQASLTHIVEDT